MNHILIIEDDTDISGMMVTALTSAGYRCTQAFSGTEALLVLSSAKPDLVLLDLTLPGLNGEKILPQIRGIPVIVVSAKADVENKVDLLLGGAADYITKPFHTKELLARIAVQLRSSAATAAGATLTFDGITLNTDTHAVTAGEREIRLTRTEYAILKLLMQNPSQVITKTQLLERISADTPDCTESSLKTHISHLRAKLREVSGKDPIEAVWGIGFKMREA